MNQSIKTINISSFLLMNNDCVFNWIKTIKKIVKTQTNHRFGSSRL